MTMFSPGEAEHRPARKTAAALVPGGVGGLWAHLA